MVGAYDAPMGPAREKNHPYTAHEEPWTGVSRVGKNGRSCEGAPAREPAGLAQVWNNIPYPGYGIALAYIYTFIHKTFLIFSRLESCPCVVTDVTNHKTFKLISKQPIQLLMTQIGQKLVVVSELHSTQTKLTMFPKSFFSSASTINKKTKCINFFYWSCRS
jgi:hypothetical protein